MAFMRRRRSTVLATACRVDWGPFVVSLRTRLCLSTKTIDGVPCQQEVRLDRSHCENGHRCTTESKETDWIHTMAESSRRRAEAHAQELKSGGLVPEIDELATKSRRPKQPQKAEPKKATEVQSLPSTRGEEVRHR